MVKYVGEAEFDYHSLNYSRDAHAVRTEVAIYKLVAIVAAVAIIADVGRINAVIERINVVTTGGRSLIIPIIARIPNNSLLFSIPNRAQIFPSFQRILLFRPFILQHRGVFLWATQI